MFRFLAPASRPVDRRRSRQFRPGDLSTLEARALLHAGHPAAEIGASLTCVVQPFVLDGITIDPGRLRSALATGMQVQGGEWGPRDESGAPYAISYAVPSAALPASFGVAPAGVTEVAVFGDYLALGTDRGGTAWLRFGSRDGDSAWHRADALIASTGGTGAPSGLALRAVKLIADRDARGDAASGSIGVFLDFGMSARSGSFAIPPSKTVCTSCTDCRADLTSYQAVRVQITASQARLNQLTVKKLHGRISHAAYKRAWAVEERKIAELNKQLDGIIGRSHCAASLTELRRVDDRIAKLTKDAVTAKKHKLRVIRTELTVQSGARTAIWTRLETTVSCKVHTA